MGAIILNRFPPPPSAVLCFKIKKVNNLAKSILVLARKPKVICRTRVYLVNVKSVSERIEAAEDRVHTLDDAHHPFYGRLRPKSMDLAKHHGHQIKSLK